MVSKFISIDDFYIDKDYALGYGHFTTIHPGHIRYLKYLKSLSPRVIIAVRGDINEKNNTIINFYINVINNICRWS